MPKKPTDKADDNKPRSNSETARRIWLAGIGAYGRAFTEAQEALKDVTGKSSEIFDELVQKGAMIEKVVEVKGKNMMEKTSVPNLDIDERIKAMRARLSRTDKGDEANEANIEARLDSLEAKMDKILQILDPQNPAKNPAKKAAQETAQKTAQKTAKKAAKKPSTKRMATTRTQAKSAKPPAKS